MNNFTHDQNQALPNNRLQRYAFQKGYRSASSFATAAAEAGVASYGTAYSKWDGRAGNSQHNVLLAIARFLGASSVEEIFDS